MILLQASHIAKHYNTHEILHDASLVVQTGDRVALVGPNGAGKSTLLRSLVGQEQPDAGEVSLGKDVSVGYVAQFVEADADTTVFQYVASTFANLYDMERRLRKMEQDMANPAVYGDESQFCHLSVAYDELQRQFSDLDGYAVEARIRRVLYGLNFPAEMHQQQVSSLSGGQKTRLSLARLLAWQPGLLVLDEPTNYLDTETLTWLENYLSGYEGALLLVSHDRYFLDKVATVVYELENGRTTRYVGNYSAYVEQKAAQYESDRKRYEAQQKEIERMETFIQKNIVRATTTKRAQSRRKMLERLERMERPSVNTPKMALRFSCARESGKDVLRISDLTVGYPDKTLPGPLNLYVSRGQRVAIVGPNGIGKTSLLKTLMGRLQPIAGTATWGHHVQLGYYDQEQSDLHMNKTVLAEVWDEYPALQMTTVRTALGRFLFRGEEVDKPVASLSGGERSRLALCKLMLQQANVLVMDEPTNHLDLISKELLEDALQDYDGTLVFVSHDRYFIDVLATHVVRLDEQGFTTYIGNYSDYMEKLREEEKWRDEEVGEGSADGGQSQRSRVAPESTVKQAAQPVAGERRHVRSADLRKLREKVAKLEADISAVEERQDAIGLELTTAAAAQDVDRTMALQQELEELTTQHDELLSDWESAAAELEELEALAQLQG